jgi:hypothetical protein
MSTNRNKELDIYIPDAALAVEVDGAYWHSRNRRPDDKLNILHKHTLAASHGIRSIHIFDIEWYDHREACQNILKAALNSVDRKIYARSCVIKNVNASDQREFLEQYHIQGYIAAKYCLGLYSNTELIGLMSIGKSRFGAKANYELYRLCFKTGVKVIGGSIRLWANLLKLFPKNTKFISYCDRRLFSGQIYTTLGFKKIGVSAPDYFYSRSGSRKESRQKFQKHKLSRLLDVFDSTLSEYENMSNNGWVQTWGTGNYIFEFIK